MRERALSIAVAGWIAFACSAAPAQTSSLFPWSWARTTAGPVDLIAVDLDGDGRDELVTGNGFFKGLSLIPNPAGGPLSGTFVPSSASPHEIAAGDVDGDGDFDVVAAHDPNQPSIPALGITWHAGNGAGGLSPSIPLASATRVYALTVADHDGDGDADVFALAALPGLTSKYGILPVTSLGGGAFQPGQMLQVLTSDAGNVSPCDVVDHDGDGIQDVVALAGGKLYRWKGTHSGAFGLPQIFASVAGVPFWWRTYVADVDGDGVPDVLGHDGWRVYALHGEPGGALAPAVDFSPPTGGLLGLEIGDGDLDGDLDVFAVEASGHVLALENEGAFTFVLREFVVSDSVDSWAFGQLDGDGLLDFALIPFDSAAVTVVPGAPGCGFQEPERHPTPQPVVRCAAGDVNVDGFDDVLATGEPDIAVLHASGGSLALVQSIAGIGLWSGTPTVFDLDGDAYPELVTTSHSASLVDNFTLLSNLGNGTFAAPVVLPFASSPEDYEPCDFDLDGDLDVITADGTWKTLTVWRNASGALSPIQTIPVPHACASIDSEDLDGDGFPDVAAACVSQFIGEKVLAFGDGSGAFPSQTVLPGATERIDAGDLTGDGLPDLLAGNLAQLFVNQGGGAFVQQAMPGDFYFGATVALADVNRDGRLDALQSLGQPGNGMGMNGLLTRLGTPSGSFVNDVTAFLPMTYGIVGDLDGSSTLEVIVGDPISSSLSELRVLRGLGSPSACGGTLLAYGAGCGYGGAPSPPALIGKGCPKVGSPFELRVVGGAVDDSIALLLFGLGQGQVPVKPGCNLLLSPLIALVIPVPLTTTTFQDPFGTVFGSMPPAAANMTFTAQAFVPGPLGTTDFGATNAVLLAVAP